MVFHKQDEACNVGCNATKFQVNYVSDTLSCMECGITVPLRQNRCTNESYRKPLPNTTTRLGNFIDNVVRLSGLPSFISDDAYIYTLRYFHNNVDCDYITGDATNAANVVKRKDTRKEVYELRDYPIPPAWCAECVASILYAFQGESVLREPLVSRTRQSDQLPNHGSYEDLRKRHPQWDMDDCVYDESRDVWMRVKFRCVKCKCTFATNKEFRHHRPCMKMLYDGIRSSVTKNPYLDTRRLENYLRSLLQTNTFLSRREVYNKLVETSEEALNVTFHASSYHRMFHFHEILHRLSKEK